MRFVVSVFGNMTNCSLEQYLTIFLKILRYNVSGSLETLVVIWRTILRHIPTRHETD
jgi:hypothetical protein